uniref:F-box domain-containing protein n=1 Tax=Strongyloides papillosus TaxID=174720 RepID=A0A0N5CHD7_STREA
MTMKSGESLIFLKLISMKVIRRKILNYLPSFYDICNLAQTSKLVYIFIQQEPLTRRMLLYDDKQRIVCRINKVLSDNCVGLKFQDIQFLKDIESERVLHNVEKFIGEHILKNNAIIFTIEKLIDNFSESERLLYVKELVGEVNLSCPLRRFSEKVIFKLENFNNQHMLLFLLSYMNHEYVSSIEIPISVLMVHSNKYYKLKENIFNGFPNFNQLILSFNEFASRCEYNQTDSERIVEKIFNELSRRQNPTLTLVEGDKPTTENFFNFCSLVLRIGTKYDIKIRYNSNISTPLTTKPNILSLFGKIYPYPKKEVIFSKDTTINNYKYFYSIIRRLQNYRCLKTLRLGFDIFDITKNFADIEKLNSPTFSLRNFKKLKNVSLNFLKYRDNVNEVVNEVYLNNLKYLISLMPSTVERLEIIYCWRMTKEIICLIREYMPNIKILKLMYFREPFYWDIIMGFKHLEAFITCGEQKINIPQNLKLLCIGSLEDDDNDIRSTIDKELLEHYSANFSKVIQHKSGKFIFFNDLRHWNGYKKYIQESFL